MRGAGRVVFAAIMLVIVGTLNIIYGIGALDEANFITSGGTRFVLDDLNTLGWVLIILGVIQLTGGFSLMAGNAYGRAIGIIGGSFGAIGRPAVDRRRLPLVVARHLRALHQHRARDHRVRRRRERQKGLSCRSREPIRRPGSRRRGSRLQVGPAIIQIG